jgi:hypothetical protein
VVGDEDAGPRRVEPVPVRDVQPPPHHRDEPAAEDLPVNVEGLTIAWADEQPDDSERRAQKEPEAADEEADVEAQPFDEMSHMAELSRTRRALVAKPDPERTTATNQSARATASRTEADRVRAERAQ